MPKSILIIDDDLKIIELLSEYLENNNYICTAAEVPSAGIAKLKNQHFDLIILDVMMPEMNGFEVCQIIRKDYDIPIIMLTSRADVTDKVVGLEMGADDYIAKPFELRELLARIGTILRRADGKIRNHQVLKFRNLVIDSNKRTAFYKNKDVKLSSTEFDLLLLFAANNGKVLSREDIMKNTRGISWESFDRSVDVMVSRLRNKFKLVVKDQKDLIKTVHSVGYIFYTEEA
jgi:DNA-binding response OmpR family regulator